MADSTKMEGLNEDKEEKFKSPRDLIYECFQKVRISVSTCFFPRPVPPQPTIVFVALLSVSYLSRCTEITFRWHRSKTSGPGWTNTTVIAASLQGSWTAWCLLGAHRLASRIIPALAFRWSRTRRSMSFSWSWISWTTARMRSTGVPRSIIWSSHFFEKISLFCLPPAVVSLFKFCSTKSSHIWPISNTTSSRSRTAGTMLSVSH